MADDSGLNRTQIFVALITVIGGVLTAIVVNADKWFSHDDAAPKVTAPITGEARREADAATPPAPVLIDLSGEWRDDEDSRFSFTQSGTTYEYTHTASSDTFQSTGKGTLEGRDLTHEFETLTGETGSCTGRINSAGNKISGSCAAPDGGWSFALER